MMRALFLLAVILLAAPAAAQTVAVDANSGVQFAPSPDHSAKDALGQEVVLAYELRLETQQVGCTVPIPQSLGKPNPGPTLIIIDPLLFLGTIPVNCTYQARVATIGQQSVMSLSPVSDPFARVTAKVPAPAGKPVFLP